MPTLCGLNPAFVWCSVFFYCSVGVSGSLPLGLARFHLFILLNPFGVLHSVFWARCRSLLGRAGSR